MRKYNNNEIKLEYGSISLIIFPFSCIVSILKKIVKLNKLLSTGIVAFSSFVVVHTQWNIRNLGESEDEGSRCGVRGDGMGYPSTLHS